jgi:cardiolipin synthase
MIVDDLWATVGSTNLDRRSFELNEELNLTVFDARIASELNRIFDDDLAHSREITYAQWRARGLMPRFFELFAIPARSQL